MSYRYTFLDSMKIDGKWGYNILLSLGADVAVRGRRDLSTTKGGVLTVNTATYFAGDNSVETYKAFIEMNDDGLTVPFSLDDTELTSPVVIYAAGEEDRVFFDYIDDRASLSSANLAIQTLPFSIAGDVEPIRWSVDAERRRIGLITPDVPLQCTASFLGKLDLSPLSGQNLKGFYSISSLINMGATAEYITFPVVNAQTYVVDY